MPAKSSIAASAVQLESPGNAVRYGVLLQADPSNTASVAVGFADTVTFAAADATDAFRLAPGQSVSIPAHLLLNRLTSDLWLISSGGTQKVFFQVDVAEALGGNAQVGTPGSPSGPVQSVQGVSGGYPVGVTGVSGSLTDRSGSITTGGTAQQIAATNAARRYLFICNTSTEILHVNFGATATSANSYPLAAAANAGEAGGSLTFEGSFIPSGLVSILGATTGSTFVAKEG